MKVGKFIWFAAVLFILLHNFWLPMHTSEPRFLGIPMWWWMGFIVCMACMVAVIIFALKFWSLAEPVRMVEEKEKG